MLLKDLSYYKTGTTYDTLYSPSSVEELAEVIHDIEKSKIPYYMLGSGSNSLVMDEHWPGSVITFSNLNSTLINGTTVVAAAGVENSKLVEQCYEASLSGISWMYFMPGQIGATTRMNARCYGGEISKIVKAVKAVNDSGKVIVYRNDEIFRGYKDTRFMYNREIIASVEFQLLEGIKDEILNQMEFCKSDRIKKNQFLFPSCGCVFKNNYEVGVPSGLLLDRAEAKQHSSDVVEISPYHANFVFNKGASSRQILETTFKMRESVYEEFGVWLEYEMEVLGSIPKDLRTKLIENRVNKIKYSKISKLKDQFHAKKTV